MINGLNSARFLLRILWASAVILPVILYFEQSIMQSLIPLLKWEITQLDDSFNILFFGVSETKGASNIELNVVFNHDIVVNQAS